MPTYAVRAPLARWLAEEARRAHEELGPYRLLGSGPEFHISCVAAGSSALHRMLVDAVERGMERLRSLDIVAPPQP